MNVQILQFCPAVFSTVYIKRAASLGGIVAGGLGVGEIRRINQHLDIFVRCRPSRYRSVCVVIRMFIKLLWSAVAWLRCPLKSHVKSENALCCVQF